MSSCVTVQCEVTWRCVRFVQHRSNESLCVFSVRVVASCWRLCPTSRCLTASAWSSWRLDTFRRWTSPACQPVSSTNTNTTCCWKGGFFPLKCNLQNVFDEKGAFKRAPGTQIVLRLLGFSERLWCCAQIYFRFMSAARMKVLSLDSGSVCWVLGLFQCSFLIMNQLFTSETLLPGKLAPDQKQLVSAAGYRPH